MRRPYVFRLEENKAVARGYFEAYNTGDIDAIMKFIGSDYVLHPGGSGESMNSDKRKRDEMVFFRAFSNIEAVVEDQIAENDKVANRITMYCTHTGEYQGVPATGKRIAITYIPSSRLEKSWKNGSNTIL